MGRVGTSGASGRLGPEAHERDMAAAARQIAGQQDMIATLKAQLAEQKASNADLARRLLPRTQQACPSLCPPIASLCTRRLHAISAAHAAGVLIVKDCAAIS